MWPRIKETMDALIETTCHRTLFSELRQHFPSEDSELDRLFKDMDRLLVIYAGESVNLNLTVEHRSHEELLAMSRKFHEMQDDLKEITRQILNRTGDKDISIPAIFIKGLQDINLDPENKDDTDKE